MTPCAPSPHSARPARLRLLTSLLAGLLGLIFLCGCASPSSRPGWEGQATPESREIAQAQSLPGGWQAVAVGTARARGLREDILCVLSAGAEPGAPLRVLVYHIWGLRLAELAVSPDLGQVIVSRPILFRVPGLDARLAKALQRSLMLRPDAQSGATRTAEGLKLRRRLPNGSAVEWAVSPEGRIQAIQGLGADRFQAEWQGQGTATGLPGLLTYRDPQDGFSLSLSFPADQQGGQAQDGGPVQQEAPAPVREGRQKASVPASEAPQPEVPASAPETPRPEVTVPAKDAPQPEVPAPAKRPGRKEDPASTSGPVQQEGPASTSGPSQQEGPVPIREGQQKASAPASDAPQPEVPVSAPETPRPEITVPASGGQQEAQVPVSAPEAPSP